MASKPSRRRVTDAVLAEKLDRLAEAVNWRANDEHGRIGRVLFALSHALSEGRLDDKKIQRILSDATGYLEQPEPSLLNPAADGGRVAVFETALDAYERLRDDLATQMGGKPPLGVDEAAALARIVLTPYDLAIIQRGAELDLATLVAKLRERRSGVDPEVLLRLGLQASGISWKDVEKFEAAHVKRVKRSSR